jgi:hypothetical protein
MRLVLARLRKFCGCLTVLYAVKQPMNSRVSPGRLDATTQRGEHSFHLLNSSEYRSGHVVLFLTWGEGEGGTPTDCATNTTDIGCHVATIVVSPSTAAGTQSGTLFNHYSLLGSTEQLLGVPPLGQAAGANSMLAAFNL